VPLEVLGEARSGKLLSSRRDALRSELARLLPLGDGARGAVVGRVLVSVLAAVEEGANLEEERETGERQGKKRRGARREEMRDER